MKPPTPPSPAATLPSSSTPPAQLTPFPAPSAEAAARAKTLVGDGDVAFQAKRYADAAAAYAQAIIATPAAAEPRYKLGVALAAQADLAAAIAAWEGVLLVAPDHEQARRNIELGRRRLEKSQAAPPDPIATLQKARALVDDGRYQSAIVLLDRLLAASAQDENIAALALRAEARLGAGDAPGAVVDWLQVLARDPRHSGAPAGLARAYTAIGDDARAKYWASW